MDYSLSSKAPARWAVDNLVKSSDRIILIHVVPKGVDAGHKEGSCIQRFSFFSCSTNYDSERVGKDTSIKEGGGWTRARHAEREDIIWQTVYVSDIDHIVTEERLADIFATMAK
ncbi:hypothetical protein E2562_006520 [Oryza meyeriana var. granulata]|uniref:UspA domain-containing protein n=1 Tax=Oryza meyeriana var. granulata TaxID=110450 RepID=A0A6G1BTU2_9ORYZ|nr:hypothetical protein E2562_006520 [Oryza meyeriana var. granulata]